MLLETAVQVQRCLRAVLALRPACSSSEYSMFSVAQFSRNSSAEVMFGEGAHQRVGRFTHER